MTVVRFTPTHRKRYGELVRGHELRRAAYQRLVRRLQIAPPDDVTASGPIVARATVEDGKEDLVLLVSIDTDGALLLHSLLVVPPGGFNL